LAGFVTIARALLSLEPALHQFFDRIRARGDFRLRPAPILYRGEKVTKAQMHGRDRIISHDGEPR
jgi:hypothetical protein